MISGLVDYILAAKDDQGREKLVYSGSCSFITTTAAGQKAEMIALAQESVQSKMPVTHWMLSWDENEIPDNAQVDEAVALFLERMVLKDHQAMYALHGNTENYHVHILVNRVHPCTEKVIQPHHGFDLEAAHRVIAEIEARQGWNSERNALYSVNDKGELVKRAYERNPVPKPKAADMERATGLASAQRMAQEKGHAVIKNAASWQELHSGLAGVGMLYAKKGSGAVIFVGDTVVKASSVDRAFSLSKLEKRLGPYVPGTEPVTEAPAPEALAVRCNWNNFIDFREKYSKFKNAISAARHANAEKMKEFVAVQKEQYRRAVAALDSDNKHIRALNRLLLRQIQKEEREAFRKELPKPYTMPPIRFKDWLRRNKGAEVLNAWRYHEYIPRDKALYVQKYKRKEYDFPYESCRKYVIDNFTDGTMAISRIDSYTTFALRCLGYEKNEVSELIKTHSEAVKDGVYLHNGALEHIINTVFYGKTDNAFSHYTEFISKEDIIDKLRKISDDFWVKHVTGEPIPTILPHPAKIRHTSPPQPVVHVAAAPEPAKVEEKSQPKAENSTGFWDKAGRALFGWAFTKTRQKDEQVIEEEEKPKEETLPVPPPPETPEPTRQPELPELPEPPEPPSTLPPRVVLDTRSVRPNFGEFFYGDFEWYRIEPHRSTLAEARKFLAEQKKFREAREAEKLGKEQEQSRWTEKAAPQESERPNDRSSGCGCEEQSSEMLFCRVTYLGVSDGQGCPLRRHHAGSPAADAAGACGLLFHQPHRDSVELHHAFQEVFSDAPCMPKSVFRQRGAF